jgi:hypothetical protein
MVQGLVAKHNLIEQFKDFGYISDAKEINGSKFLNVSY